MWICPLCAQQFLNANQVHYCGDKTIQDFLEKKSEHTIGLFYHFISEYKQLAQVSVHPAKTMIAIASKTRIAYITQLGKDFIDVVFPFPQSYNDNLCFSKIKQVPGTSQFNHYFRMKLVDDLNDEIKEYMLMACKQGC